MTMELDAILCTEILHELIDAVEEFRLEDVAPKLAKKNLDMVAANNVKVEGAGFQGDTNVLTLITQDEEISLPLMSKEDAAFRILDKILSLMQDSVC
mgnify:CR=1 FL=1